MGKSVANTSEPSDTKPKHQIVNMQITPEISTEKKESGKKTPTVVATALPPLKPKKIE